MITREQLLKNERFWTETIQNKIYNDLATFVEKENISQKELAKRLGVSKGRISQILNGDNLNFRIETLVKICMAIGKIPSFSMEDINSYIHDDVKANHISCVYKQELLEYSGLVKTIKFIPPEGENKRHLLEKNLGKALIDNYRSPKISEAI